jgi:UDP-2-acetamido-2-deoxy-ribo-hexuluronate aminotransferase
MIPFVDLKPYTRLVSGINGPRTDVWAVMGMHDFLEHGEFIGGGPTTQAFEAALAKKLSAQHAIACANGTDALQLALRASGVGPGHRVAMPNITFWATYEAIVNVGATPVLLDIDDADYQLSLDALIRAHDLRRLDAVVLPHLFGWCSGQLAEIRAFCHAKRLPLIEDGAQAFGVKYAGESVFKDAEIATLSFYPAKVIGGIGDGGAVLMKDERTAKRVRRFANHGRSAHFEHVAVGCNSRMDAIQAAWLLRALDVADRVIEERRQLVRLCGCGVHVVPPMNVDDNGYLALNMVRATSQYVHYPDQYGYHVQRQLHDLGVEGRRLYPITIASQPGAAFAEKVGNFPVSRAFAEQAFCLPLYYGMTVKQIEHCTKAFEEVLRR